MNKTLRILSMGCLITLCSCASGLERAQKRMADNLDPLIGQTIAFYVGQRGAPQSVVDMGLNDKMFQWVITGQTPAIAVPIGGAIIARGPQTLECRISLRAYTKQPNPTLNDWIISGYQWAGSC